MGGVAAGRQFEYQFFGRHGHNSEHPWISEEAALKKVLERDTSEQNAIWNPSCPGAFVRGKSSLWGHVMYLQVYIALPMHLRPYLRLYCSLDTELDQHHHTDGFFKLLYVEGWRGIVPFDLTLRDKVQGEKVIVIRKDTIRDRGVRRVYAEEIVRELCDAGITQNVLYRETLEYKNRTLAPRKPETSVI